MTCFYVYNASATSKWEQKLKWKKNWGKNNKSMNHNQKEYGSK